MQLGACSAGLAIENSMLGAAHALANPLTAQYGIAHGEAIGLMLPHVIRHNGQQVEAWYRGVVEVRSRCHGFPGKTSECEPKRWPSFVSHFSAAAGLAGTLKECDVPREDLPKLADAGDPAVDGQIQSGRNVGSTIIANCMKPRFNCRILLLFVWAVVGSQVDAPRR